MGILKSLVNWQKSYNERQRGIAKDFNSRKRELENQGVLYCPKCLSTNVNADKKGFSTKKAVTGAILTGGIGLVAGNIGANKIKLTCLKCGYTWDAGQKE